MTKDFTIGFIVGAGLGALVTYFVATDRIRKKDEEELDGVRSVNAQLRCRIKDLEGSESASENKVDNTPRKGFRRVSGASSDSQEAQNAMKDEILKNHYNYSSVSGEYDEEGGGEIAMPKKSMIYAITGDEFDNGNEEYDKASLTWYLSQHILTDEDDHRISTECVGGDDMLKDFEDDVKYVRNDALNSDYEIVVDDVNHWSDEENE